MNFGEKLTKLRKQKGLSQEELGYELNVTRQTISKWELGQTTPEMDKLVEMSKIFGISVDDLLNETKEVKTETQKIADNKSRKKTIITIVSVVLGIIILLAILGKSVSKKLFNIVEEQSQKGTQMVEDVWGTGLDIIEKQGEQAEKQKQEGLEQFNQIVNQMNEEYDQQVEKEDEKYNQKVESMQEKYNQGAEKANQLMQQMIQ